AELTGAYRLAANLAARVLFDLRLLQLRRVSELSDDDKAKHQLIAIGAASRNPLVAPVLAKTTVQVTPGGLTRTGAAVAPEIGVLAVQPSPWNPTFRVLTVTGATDDAVTRGGDPTRNPA